MPGTTVATLNAKYIADTAEFERGLGDVDRALRQTKSIIRDATRPMDRYNTRLQDIEMNLREGKITQEQARLAIEKANQTYERATGKVERYGNSLQRLTFLWASVVAASYGVSRVLRALTSTFAEVAEAARKASAFGLTLQQLEGLRDVGQEAGFSANTLDMAIQRMTRRLSEAGVGAGEAKGALKELGLNAEALSKLKTVDQAKAIADAFSRVSDEQDRLRLAMRLFDSEGARLGNTFGRLGSRGIDRYLDRQREMGVLTDNQVDRMMSVQQAIEDLTKVMRNVGRQLAATFSDTFRVMAKQLEEIAKFMAEIIQLADQLNLRQRALGDLGHALPTPGVPLGGDVRQTTIMAGRLAAAFNMLLRPLDSLFEKFDRLSTAMGEWFQLATKLTFSAGQSADKAAKAEDQRFNALTFLLALIEFRIAQMKARLGIKEETAKALEGPKPAIPEGTPALERGSLAAFQFLQQLQRDRMEEDLAIQQEQLATQKQIAINTSGTAQRIPSGAQVAVG